MNWQALDVENWPEDSDTSIYCSTCGQKNRGDEGWLYKIHPQDSAFARKRDQQIQMLKLQFSSYFETVGGLQQNEYICSYCREREIIGLSDITKLSVKQLREHLKNLHEPTSGSKAVLMERLTTVCNTPV